MDRRTERPRLNCEPQRQPLRLVSVALLIGLGLVVPAKAVAGDAEQLQRSYQLEAQKRYATALGALDKVSRKGKTSYIFKLRRAWLLHLNARYAEAIAAYKKAIGAAPKALEARLGLTLPQMALRRFADAAETAKAAMTIDRDNYTATSRYAYCNYNLGRYAESARYYERLVELYPSDVDMLSGLGWAQLKLGKKREAARTFGIALAAAPKHEMALQGMALCR
jgi:tetratricopeptide (TPR) repeat protein